MTTFLIVIVVLVLIAGYFISVYNKLVSLKNMVEEAWSGIDVQLKKRHNLIPNLVNTVKAYAKHENETFIEVTAARNAAENAEGVKEQEQAENKLNSSLLNLYAVAEQYPELKANENFLKLQDTLDNVEQDIERARRYYNGTVREQNITVQSFPSNIVAGAFSFSSAEFFEIDSPSERAVPDVNFD